MAKVPKKASTAATKATRKRRSRTVPKRPLDKSILPQNYVGEIAELFAVDLYGADPIDAFIARVLNSKTLEEELLLCCPASFWNDAEATKEVLFAAAQFIESEIRTGVDELRKNELDALIEQVIERTNDLLDSHSRLIQRLTPLRRGYGPGHEILQGMSNVIGAFSDVVAPVKTARAAAEALLQIIPMEGSDKGGSVPLSARLRGNRIKNLAFALAIAFGRRDLDIRDRNVRFLKCLKSFYGVLDSRDPHIVSLPDESNVMSETRDFFSHLLERGYFSLRV